MNDEARRQPSYDATGNTTSPLRDQARALLALGWWPSLDEPGRIYPIFANMPSAKTTYEGWRAMHEILAERQR